MMTSMTTVAVNQEGAFMNVNIIGNKVFVNGSPLPPIPGAKSSVSLSQVGITFDSDESWWVCDFKDTMKG